MGIKFCSACGGRVGNEIPVDDDHIRAVCTQCGAVHYENPKMVVGCIPVRDDKILMCKRNIEPRKGLWTLPAGFLENGETVQDGAARETMEETGSAVEIIAPYRMYNIVFVHQIYLMFRARLMDENFRPTKESSEIMLVDEDHIPWDDIAFEVIRRTLKNFLADREKGIYEFKVRDLSPPPEWRG